MALHQLIQKLLLLGVRIDVRSSTETAEPAEPPERLRPLIDAVRRAHRHFDQRALHFGHLYRSSFWAIYLLSAVAVLCAVLPLALGWDDWRHRLHSMAGFWTIGEVVIISAVATIYWVGHRRAWQGQWLRARTTAELIWYLPLLAPLVDFTRNDEHADWYLRVFDPGQDRERNAGQNGVERGDVAALCASLEPLARERLAHAWADPEFVASYARWTVGILAGQEYYHHGVAIKQNALQHRVHSLNSWLFGLTALGALAHLVLHTLWLSLVTTFFPALGASLHGALAQSEAYRLGVTSERLTTELHTAIQRIRAAAAVDPLRRAIEAALSLILEEHQDWHMLVMPHRLPLA